VISSPEFQGCEFLNAEVTGNSTIHFIVEFEEFSFNKETRYIKNISGFFIKQARRLLLFFGPVGFRAFPFQNQGCVWWYNAPAPRSP
jgi:hypothetical protein